jgi:tetratricopeptide (TPR) repeat protein
MKLFTVCRLAVCLALLSAVILFSSACSRDPNVRKQKYFDSGQQYFAQGKYREAAIEFFNAIQIDQGFAEAHYRLAECYLKVQQWSPAYQELSRTVELQPENYEARDDLAKLLIAARNFDAAHEQTEWLSQHRPNDSQTHVVISSLLAAQGSFPAAVQEMEKAIELAPNHSDLYLGLALLQIKTNQLETAETNFKRAIDLDPKAVDPPYLLGNFYGSRGRFGEAEQQLKNAIQIDPKDPNLRGALARLYLVEGKKDVAEEYVRTAKLDFPDDSRGYRMLGDLYFATGDIDKATAEYAAVFRDHPSDLEGKKNYIQLLILKGQTDEARTLTNEILAASPQDSDALIARAQLQIQDGHLSEASATLQTVTKNDPQNSVGHYYLGVGLEKMGSLAQAETEWRDAARLRPDLLQAQRALAGVAMRRGDMVALQQAAEQIIHLEPGSPDGYALQAVSNINRRLYAPAEQSIRQAIAVAPQSAVGYVQMGNLKLVQRQFPEAAKAYQEGLDRDANSIDALRGLINTYVMQGQVDRAIVATNAQIAKAPNSSGFYDLLGTVLFQNKKDWNGAETAFRKSAELDRSNTGALIKLGEVQTASGHADLALATYQQSVQEHPREANFYILMGQLYEARQDWNNAQNSYQKALELKPADPIASNNLANVMVQTGGNVDIALSLAQTARRALPDSSDVADTLGWIYYQKGAYQSAIGLLQEAIKLREKNNIPEDPGIHFHLGLAYQKAGKPELARQQLERVLKLDPNYGDAAEVRKQLAQLKS